MHGVRVESSFAWTMMSLSNLLLCVDYSIYCRRLPRRKLGRYGTLRNSDFYFQELILALRTMFHLPVYPVVAEANPRLGYGDWTPLGEVTLAEVGLGVNVGDVGFSVDNFEWTRPTSCRNLCLLWGGINPLPPPLPPPPPTPWTSSLVPSTLLQALKDLG